jgi:pyruvate/2-oxoglutarate dehydrogenase complex dihydrolipoamide dehydrogenase (E3) component
MPMTGPTPAPPRDEHNQKLVANVRPGDWKNPVPASGYNLVVIGAGTAGLVTAAGAAGLGAKVALIEKHWMGGDCLNVGCVPSKTLIRAARAAYEARHAGRFGIHVPQVEVDFAAVMERVRAVRADISPHDSAQRFTELGVDVFLGEGCFVDSKHIEVGGAKLRFKRAVIATGARAAQPDIPGLREAGFLTNETIFNLTSLPRRLAVIGGGPIGCELAQAFQRLGAQVTLFHNKSHLLDREDADAARIVQEQFVREGIQLMLGAVLTRVETRGAEKVVHFETPERGSATPSTAEGQDALRLTEPRSESFDAIFIGAGRAPNVDGLNLEGVGVAFDHKRGVRVNDHLRTTNSRIFAAGDVCMDWKFTHAADFAARIVIQNALFFGRKKLSALTMPWATYTDPEIAHVGLYEREAEARGVALETFTQSLDKVDRALTDDEAAGFVKIHVLRNTDAIVGATIVGPHAGDMLSEVSVAMAAGMGLGKLANVIHPYPTLAEAIRKCGDACNRTRLTPRVKSILEKWLSWSR